MERKYFSKMIPLLASRSAKDVVSYLGCANISLRCHLMEFFSQPYGERGSFLADPAFEATFGWKSCEQTLRDLSKELLSPELVNAMNKPPKELENEYRFAKDLKPYSHQLKAWQILKNPDPHSVVVSSGTGSGKTECFLIPILDQLIQEQKKTGKQLRGVRALFLYPLNALINSQRDRLLAWTNEFDGNIRFCLYNGRTPDRVDQNERNTHPNEVLDRETLRTSPPPILITNATMLEFMLSRAQDAPIIEKSQGTLEWIVLDEAHSYIGSQAAEMALLIRRVLHAFNVDSEKVRFVATSATIGDPNEKEGLRSFIASIAGIHTSRVVVIEGERTIPELPPLEKVVKETTSLEDLFNSTDNKERCYDLLVNHPIARKIRKYFEMNRFAKLSEISSLIFPGGISIPRKDQDQKSLEWLDLLSSAKSEESKLPFLPLRAHIFHQTLAGLWACADSACPEKRGTKLDNRDDWPFGQIYESPQERCTCGAPCFEVVTCNDCGAVYLLAENEEDVLLQPIEATVIDEFELDLESSGEDDDSDFDSNTEEKKNETRTNFKKTQVIITNLQRDNTESFWIDRVTRKMLPRAAQGVLKLIGCENNKNKIACPFCESTGTGKESVFRHARIGAPFLLGGIFPTSWYSLLTHLVLQIYPSKDADY